MEQSFNIQYVACYLRKSRGEDEKDLTNHRYLLRDMCVKNSWKYVEYMEIASSENIEYRPKFKQLLKDVERQLYDAVLVVDYQRLGRGDIEDQGLIKRVFRDSGTYIVTPNKIYNLVDDTDDLLVDVRGLIARQEYKSIQRNLQRGKKIGAMLGRWTNGPAPFPYLYDPSIKGLVVDKEKNAIYQEMKRMVLNNVTCKEVSWYLNNKGTPSPKNSVWHENTVRRIMIDETHLGRVISNKTTGSGHKNKKTKPIKQIPREEWTIVENCHEAVKTIEEHESILSILAQRKIIPHAARRGAFVLSGLVRCGKCGNSMQFIRKKNRSVSVKTCQHTDPYGNRCTNRGLKVDVLMDAITNKLQQYEQTLLSVNDYDNEEERKWIKDMIQHKEETLRKRKNALSRIKEMYEIGDYTREEYEERKEARNREIKTLEDDIAALKAKIKHEERKTNEERIAKIKELKEIWNSDVDEKTKNNIAKQVISKVSYIREGDDVSIKVSFL